MKVVIFAGPTISAGAIREILPDALILAPCEQGDIEFATRTGADCIGLIDGVHRQSLPPWHKEILIALSRGCRLLGASSMGALRAVECQPWGAEPIGKIASWLQDGTVEADDELCVSHLGAEHKYRAMSLALVNVRASLIASQLSTERCKVILEAARALWYPDRCWPAIFHAAACTANEQDAIIQNELDLKAIDALQLLYYIKNLPPKPVPQREVKYSTQCYGKVFLWNDSKTFYGHRQHEIAGEDPKLRAQAMNRILALEFCKMAGITEPLLKDDEVPGDDLSGKEVARLCAEERILAKAREWLSSSGMGFGDVPAITDFLRVCNGYQGAKQFLAKHIEIKG